MEKQINLNDVVKVKLTPQGVEILKNHHLQLCNQLSLTPTKKFSPPNIDKDGYSNHQLHRLFHVFGHHIKLGIPLPFETSIIIDIDNSNEQHDIKRLSNALSVAIQLLSGDFHLVDEGMSAKELIKQIGEDNNNEQKSTT